MNCNCLNSHTKKNYRKLFNYGALFIQLPILNYLDVVQCLDCGLVFSPQYPQHHEDLAMINKALGVTFDTGKMRASQKILEVERMLQLSKIKSYGIVDVGGGAGHFAEVARLKGFQARNFEPFSVNSEEQILSNVASKLDSVNLVLTMFHVFEHIVEPISWISQLIGEVQKDFENIYLIIEVPVIELEAPFSDDPTPYYAPFHTRHFSIETARALFANCGLQVIREKAASDYNGFFFLLHQTNSKEVYQIDIKKEKSLQDNYLENRKNSMRFLKNSLSDALSGISFVVFWGAGLGHDFFMHEFGDVFQGTPNITVDKSIERQVRDVESPEILRKLFKVQKSILVIPTSFAKSAEIIQEASHIAITEEYESIFFFDYVNVRAY